MKLASPEPLFVVLIDLLGFKSHLYDSEGKHHDGGLENLFKSYFLFDKVIYLSTKAKHLDINSTNSIKVFKHVNYFVASDIVILWANKEYANYLVIAASKVLDIAFSIGVPLRGTLAYGDCIFKPRRNIYIGYPIIEAIEAEKYQEWLGIGVLKNAASHLKGVEPIVEYLVPLKSNKNLRNMPSISHAIAWHWKTKPQELPKRIVAIKKMLRSASDRDKIKYENTLTFINKMPGADCPTRQWT